MKGLKIGHYYRCKGCSVKSYGDKTECIFRYKGEDGIYLIKQISKNYAVKEGDYNLCGSFEPEGKLKDYEPQELTKEEAMAVMI